MLRPCLFEAQREIQECALAKKCKGNGKSFILDFSPLSGIRNDSLGVLWLLWKLPRLCHFEAQREILGCDESWISNLYGEKGQGGPLRLGTY